jgi:HK97 family phage major capsid protein
MHEVSKNKDRPNEQNVAICMSKWRDSKGEKKSLDQPFYRSARIVSGTVDPDKRTVSFSFSSRYAVKRRVWDKSFREVLSHDPGAVVTDRLERGVVPLLWNHNWDNRIGVIRSWSIQDGRGMAVAEFSPNQNGQDALADVRAGIQSAVSVGYIPRKIRCLRKRGVFIEPDDNELPRGYPDDDPDDDLDPDDSADDDDNDGDNDDEDDDDLYEVARWEPIEISFVSVPADPTVGVGRGNSETYEVMMLDAPDEVVPHSKVNLEREQEPFMPTENVTSTTTTPSLPPPPAIEVRKEEMRQVQEVELTRIREIIGYGAQFKAEVEAQEFVRSGKTVAEFQSLILKEKLPNTKPLTVMADPTMGFGARDQRRYSITRAIKAKLKAQSGEGRFDGFEAEVSREMALISGQDPQGFYVPDWFLTRDLTVAPPATTGLTVQTTVEPSLIPLLRNRTAVLQAGARYISGLQGNLLMPRQNAPSTISWNTEIAAVTESDLAMDSVTLSPNRVGGWCNYSKQLLAQSSLDIDNVVRDDMIQVIQIAIDGVAITGTGTNQPTGILNTAANAGLPYSYAKTAPSITFPTGGAPSYPTWVNVVDFEANVEAGNLVLDDSAAYITTPQVKGQWKALAKNDPRNTAGPFYPMFFWEAGDRVNGYRAIATNQVSANKVVFGKWNELMIGQWAGLDIVVDIYTLATQAEIRVITNMFVDVKYRYASAFCYSTNSGVSNP